jgi:hypothetical protein
MTNPMGFVNAFVFIGLATRDCTLPLLSRSAVVSFVFPHLYSLFHMLTLPKLPSFYLQIFPPTLTKMNIRFTWL